MYGYKKKNKLAATCKILWWIQGTRVDDTKNGTRNEDRQFTLRVLISRICV